MKNMHSLMRWIGMIGQSPGFNIEIGIRHSSKFDHLLFVLENMVQVYS